VENLAGPVKVLSDGGSQLSDPTQPAAPPKTEWWQDTYATVVTAGAEPATKSGSDANEDKSGSKGSGGQKTDR